MLEGVDVAFLQFIPFHQPFGYVLHLVRNLLVGSHLVLEPVTFLGVAKGGHEVVVVGVIVVAVERRDVFVALNQHSLFAESVVVQRAMHLSHPVLACPLLCPVQKHPCHLDVIDCVEPSETGTLL